ncbi:hypothetical protein T492DRAFT_580192, partial [Pavlovales sp. CCMP2436]
YPHLRKNLKRATAEDERFRHIELENRVLLSKMSTIMGQNRSPFDGTLEFQPGPRSLNHGLRRTELQRIARENEGMVRRITGRRANYTREKWLSERKLTEQYLGRMSDFP